MRPNDTRGIALKFIRPFFISLQFLTTFPVRLQHPPQREESGQALLWYPLVGALIGLVLTALLQVLHSSQPLLDAVLVVTAWVLMTGGLHLDGLADTADAWVGGHGDRERTLAIMKDPRAGSMAVIAIVLVLLLKIASLTILVSADAWCPVLAAPVLGRAAMPLLLLTTPYVRADGLGAVATAQLPRGAAIFVVSIAVIAMLAGLHLKGVALVAASAVVFVAARLSFQRRLGGVTGDCCGALLEAIETAVLLAGALSS